MRDILFRGKTLKDGEWIEGSLYIREQDVHGTLGYLICHVGGCCRLVDPKTVGQFIGLKDKHDKRIFEGDVVLQHNSKSWCEDDFEGVVIFQDGKFRGKSLTLGHYYDFLKIPDFEIIGNIHEKKEKELGE